MTEDVIVDVTADFIRSSEKNLTLAFQVERAMPSVREHFVKIALEAVADRFPQDDWIIDRSQMQNVMAKNASLDLRNSNWPAGADEASGTYITLATDQRNWMSVWFGAYITGQLLQKLQSDEGIVARSKSRGFVFAASYDPPLAWKYLDGDIRDWSGERFLTGMFHEDGRDQIVSEISANLTEICEFVGSLG